MEGGGGLAKKDGSGVSSVDDFEVFPRMFDRSFFCDLRCLEKRLTPDVASIRARVVQSRAEFYSGVLVPRCHIKWRV